MRGLYIGTSGWHYPHWRDRFYPHALRSSQWLRFYAQQLRCVEVNNSFYRLPTADTARTWYDATPGRFRFCIKAWQTITHRKKLKNCQAAVDALLESVQPLGRKLGPILFQLPPRWHCNLERLRDFLKRLPEGLRTAFEFRDTSWHNDDVYGLLREYDAAFCIYDLEGVRSAMVATTDLVYIRLHGPGGAYAGSYRAAALRAWASRIDAWRRSGRTIYVMFNNDEAAFAPKNALLLEHLVVHDNQR